MITKWMARLLSRTMVYIAVFAALGYLLAASIGLNGDAFVLMVLLAASWGYHYGRDPYEDIVGLLAAFIGASGIGGLGLGALVFGLTTAWAVVLGIAAAVIVPALAGIAAAIVLASADDDDMRYDTEGYYTGISPIS